MQRMLSAALCAALGAGCAASQPDYVPAADHPAAPNAPMSEIASPSQAFADSDPLKTQRPPGSAAAGATQHDHGGLPGMSHEAAPPASQAAAAYVCPMDPDVTSDKPGTCPKCGMKLVKNEQGGDSGHH